jgi:hypothetical protein
VTRYGNRTETREVRILGLQNREERCSENGRIGKGNRIINFTVGNCCREAAVESKSTM